VTRAAGRRLRVTLALCVLGALLANAQAAGATEPSPPQIAAPEALLVETDLGATLVSHHAERRVSIASTTKLMTAYVTLQREPLNRVLVEQPYAAGSGESLAGLPAGGRYSVAQLLRAMLLPSGNDVANSLAIDIGGTIPHFLWLMNQAAARLGLTRTHYTTPVGLDTPGNYSTARDLETLAEALLHDRFFAAVVREQYAYLPGGIEVANHEAYLLAEYPFLVGVKSGHTADAGYCFVGAASWHGVHVISVVLGDATQAERDADSIALLRYGLSLYRHVRIAVKGHTYASVPVSASAQQVALIAPQNAGVVVRHGAKLAVSLNGVPSMLTGPLPAGTQEGTLEVTENGQPVLEVPLVTATDVASPLTSSVGLYGVIASALLACAGCSLMVMRSSSRRREQSA
jgi:D-alanyl-D-alanine carboxypeptidase (penicillin-binding protein 5/6)